MLYIIYLYKFFVEGNATAHHNFFKLKTHYTIKESILPYIFIYSPHLKRSPSLHSCVTLCTELIYYKIINPQLLLRYHITISTSFYHNISIFINHSMIYNRITHCIHSCTKHVIAMFPTFL